MTNIDLHVHTPASSCASWRNWDELVECIKASSLDFFCITDHGTIDGYLQLVEHYPEIQERIFPGIEVTSVIHGDFLVYSDDLDFLKGFQRNYNFRDLSRILEERKGIAVVWAHPALNTFYDTENNPLYIPEIAPLLDGVEVFNGARLDCNALHQQIVREVRKYKDVTCTGGSDAHTQAVLGRAYTEFDDIHNIADMIKAIKNGETIPKHI